MNSFSGRAPNFLLSVFVVSAVSSVIPLAAYAQASVGGGSEVQQTSEAKIPDDPITFDSLTLEIALVRKTLADERFLANDREGARRAYCEARDEIAGGFQLSTAKGNTLELLKADIEYRLLLLDRGIDFWGAVQTLQPSMPGAHLVALEGLLADFEKQSAEITAAVREIGKGDIETGKLEAISREIDGRVRSETVNQQRIAIERTFQEDRQDGLDGRIVELKSNRKRLENQIASAVADAHAASARLSKALANAAASSLGVPPDVLQSVKEGKLDKAVLSVVTNSDLLKSADFSSALSQVGASNEVIAGYVKQGQDLIRRGQEVKEQLESYKADLEAAAQAFRNPTIDGLAQVGSQIYSRLDNNTKREWTERIRAAKPVLGAVQLIRSVEEPAFAQRLREGAERYLSSDANFARDYLKSAIDKYVESVDNLVDSAAGKVGSEVESAAGKVGSEYAKLLGEISQLRLDDSAVEHLLDQVLRSWPGPFLTKLPRPALDGFLKVAGVDTREALQERLRQTGLKLVRDRINIRADRVEVFDRSGTRRTPVIVISLAVLGTLPQGNPTESYGFAAKDALAAELNRLRRSEGELRRLLLKRLPQDALESALRRTLTLPDDANNKDAREADLKDNAWNAIVQSLPTQKQRDQVVEKITSVHVGSVYVSEHEQAKQEDAQNERRLYAGTGGTTDAGGGGGGRSKEDAMAEQMALLALNAVLPGASVVADVIGSFFAFGEAVDKAKKLAAELQANLSEELQVIELVNEARLKQVVFGKEREISEIMKASAKAQYESYRFAVTQSGVNQDKERSHVTIRRKLAFYLAERMREEYDGLDRSLALWAGRLNSPRGVIAELVKSDPQNVRLALDSEVHLFDWLNRERESTRTDVDGLMVHWRQLIRLSKDLCARLGCTTGTGALGQLHQTDAIRLTDLLSPEDERRLRRWKSTGSRESITLTLFLSPDGRFVPLGIDNVRVVDVRIGSKWPSGRVTALTRVRLSHPGVGYIQSNGETARQVLLPVHRWGHMPPEPFDIQELAKSWQTGASGRTRDFEGYPFYTAWQVTLDPVVENIRADEIWLRFAYRYIDRANTVTERQYLDTTESGPAAIFEPAVLWENKSPEATVNMNGRVARVALPKRGKVSVPFSAVPLIHVRRSPPKPDPCSQAMKSPAGPPVDSSPEPTKPGPEPAVFAVCKPEEDIRRAFTHFHRAKGESDAKAAELAGAEVSRLKKNECSSPRPISALEVRR